MTGGLDTEINGGMHLHIGLPGSTGDIETVISSQSNGSTYNIDPNVINSTVQLRNSEMETSVQIATAQLKHIQQRLEALTESDIQKQISVISEIDVKQAQSVSMISTVARELQFCSSHAIHHYALIKLIRQIQGGKVDKHFGLAPSTISYQASLQN